MDVHCFGVEPITCHAWNKDHTEVALCPNNADVQLYKREAGGGWSRGQTLSRHDLRVTSIDWAPRSNRIVTCAADRNAYVWTLGSEEPGTNATVWTPTLVLLRINRAATCVRWSPLENKFAVGSGAKLVSVCYFEEDHNWWVSKHIKKPIKSTVTSVDWHPNNCLLACGSTDFRTRVFSAYIKEVDSTPQPTPWNDKSPSFGSLVAELSASGIGWVHSVCFSGDGTRLAWVGHDSSVCVADAQRGQAITCVRTQYLPFLSCLWVSPTRLLLAGYDCYPMVYEYSNGQLSFVDKLDKSQRKEVDGVSAMRKFLNMDKHAMESRGDTLLDTAHQNAITLVTLVQGDRDNATRVCTQGMDGRLILWDIKQTLQSSMASMRIV
ncbi:actin-related protein 2/3 complex subunit 1A-A isoform X2 [Dermacentor albipictus]|uniref:actin-related protein 2/3 complex subunit 1A-A isoform X2 n=1 Tax=Dermacentor albipictus TaxID=60249 RepID=UPI0038FC3BD5